MPHLLLLDLLLVVPSVVLPLIILTKNQHLDHLDGKDLTVALRDIVTENLSIGDGGLSSIRRKDAVDVNHRNVTAANLIVVEEDKNVAVAAQELTDVILGLDATLINIATEDGANLSAPNVIIEDLVKDVMDLTSLGVIAVTVPLAVTKEDHATTTTAKDDQDNTAKIAANPNLAAVKIKKIVKVTIV